MKYIFPFIVVAVLFAGCAHTSIDTSMPKKLSKEKTVQFQLVTTAQDAVFMVGHGYTGGMGSMPLLDDAGNVQQVDGLPVYVDEQKVKEITAKGNIPSCVVGKPRIEVSGTIHLEKKTSTNSSLEDAPEISYYVAKIDELKKVKIDATPCK